MKKQPEITEKTKQALATAFCNLYMQKSIDKITIKEITCDAGYNRSTFYQYFTDVYNLLEYIEDDVFAEVKKSWISGNDSMFHPDLTQLLSFFNDKEHYLQALLGDYGYVHFLSRLKQELSVDELQKNLSKAGEITPYLAEFHITTSLSLFRVWIKRNRDISADDLMLLIHNLYTKGISYLTE